MLAALNHPNIAHIHGFEDSGGHALVMELVEGPTLADRIRSGRLPLDEALPIAKQMAEALEAAHEQGIIHRDLKPANIKVRRDGTVKVLDFGLAKALSRSQRGRHEQVANALDRGHRGGSHPWHRAYMSPEQARGKMVDRRADVWAFGAVLYEMLSGKHAFGGTVSAHTLALVLTNEPQWTTLPAKTPEPIRRLLRRCLDKDTRRRLASASDARLEIEDALHGSYGCAAAVVVGDPRPIHPVVASDCRSGDADGDR